VSPSSSTPLATVVVATHNGARFVARTLESLLAQSVGPLQIVVCDDGSSDNTPALLQTFGSDISVVRQQNRGVSAARNRGAALARARHIAFLDHDDVWEPYLLERQLAQLARYPDAGLAYADSWVVDDNDRKHGRRRRWLDYREGDVQADLLLGNFVPLETALMPTAIFRRLGGFNEELRYLEDYDLFLRLSALAPVVFLDQPLARYRIHDSNLSHHREALLAEWVLVLEQLLEQGPRPAAERARIEGQIGLRAGETAWHALRRGDADGARAWLRRARGRCPSGVSTRVRLLHALVAGMPAGLSGSLRRLLPRHVLYGVRLGRGAAQSERSPA